MIVQELNPGSEVQTDEELTSAYLRYHITVVPLVDILTQRQSGLRTPLVQSGVCRSLFEPFLLTSLTHELTFFRYRKLVLHASQGQRRCC